MRLSYWLLAIDLVALVMAGSFLCGGCSEAFATSRGLGRHQENCEEFMQADVAENTVENALDIYLQRKARKKRKLNHPSTENEATPSLSNVTNPAPQLEPMDDLMPDSPPMDIEPPNSGSFSPEFNAATSSESHPLPEGRGRRAKRPTWKVLQQRPEPPNPVAVENPVSHTTTPDDDATPPPSIIPEIIWKPIRTTCNAFGIYREYATMPTHCPDDFLSLSDLADSAPPPTTVDGAPSPPLLSRLAVPTSLQPSNAAGVSSYFPFANSTIFGLMNWMWSGSAMKSIAEVAKLINFLKSDDFKKEDLEGFDIHSETAKLDKNLNNTSDQPTGLGDADIPHDGWRESSVGIEVPDGKPHSEDNNPIPVFTVPGLTHRSLVDVIKATLEDPTSESFHYTPFKSFWKNVDDSNAEPERLYDEVYSSDAMLEAHLKLQQQAPEPDCDLERVVASIMLWSDSTHLASFGTASLWPIYLFFGNQSKYTRGKPTTASCHHIAYIPKLEASFFDFYNNLTGDGPTPDTLTHCRRELMHAVWQCLLDEKFLDAYEHGIVVKCPDGVQRRFYPRIFTYSADYPEKVLLANIRNLGAFPCPRCLVPKTKIPEVGTKPDDKRRDTTRRRDDFHHRWNIRVAREFIYEKGYGVKSAAVEGLLASKSLVPTKNAFSCLSRFGFNFFDMLVPDFMHEFELGVWKATFTHLVRIFVAQGEGVVQAFNSRYRQVPTFGRSTIRRFSENASAMKKLAARNYEDLLQCAIPVFDGLLPDEHNDAVLSLLFTLAEWHCLGKLRLHTSVTLGWLENCTTNLGQQLRRFQKYTCAAFDTRELPKEEAARSRRKKRGKGSSSAATAASSSSGAGKKKFFNLILFKLHALGDYVRTIKLFGTSDSYSTQPGELEHRRVKRFYARTNKNRAIRQMTRLERREHAMRRLARKLGKAAATTASSEPEVPNSLKQKGNKRAAKHARPTVNFDENEPLPYTPPEVHHHISPSRNFPIHVHDLLSSTSPDDPAIKDFYPKLLNHLRGRMKYPDLSDDGEQFPPEENARICIVNDRLFRHKVMRVNYTSYDVRQGQDSINSRNHADVMVLSRNDPNHPFEYARVIGIFHVDVVLNEEGASRNPVSKEFLWVRWFQRDPSYRAGFERKRLHRLRFLPSDNSAAFGFLDPDDVIRSAHIIPAFRYKKTDELLKGESFGRAAGELDDWAYHYVNIFVDRDMYMRYAGRGIGHYPVDTGDTAPAQPVTIIREETIPDNDEPPDSQESAAPSSIEEVRAAAISAASNPATTDSSPEDEDVDEENENEEDDDEEPENEEDDDLGAEDGEGGFIDAEDDEGYAPL